MTRATHRNMPITKERRAAFLEQLRIHGVVSWAAKAVSPYAVERHGASSSFYALKARDVEFSQEWDLAIQEANDRLIVEARRRAIEGVGRLRTHKDQLIKITDPETGEERPLEDREYSDRLMEVLLKGHFPNLYVERRVLEHIQRPTLSGWTVTKEDMACLSNEQADQLMAIIKRVRDHRRDALAIEHQPGEIIDAEYSEVLAEPSMMPDPETGLLPWEQN